MIHVGIIGAESAIAGDLIRLLILHPEVELIFLHSPEYAGKNVSAVHRGIVGETALFFTDELNLEGTDLIFIASHVDVNDIDSLALNEKKLIILYSGDSGKFSSITSNIDFVPAVSELFRKPLVRGAQASRVLDATSVLVLISLFPLARHLLLNDTVDIHIEIPDNIEITGYSKEESLQNIDDILKQVQLSFNGINKFDMTKSNFTRTTILRAELNCAVSTEEIQRLYEETYDDHNFTFLVDEIPHPSEVAGTQKVLIHISKTSDTVLHIDAIADNVMRGGAGDAIHAMNLLFGLFEKTGLSFPASMAFRYSSKI